MLVNLIDVPAIDSAIGEVTFKVINLYPYLINALDIYIVCSKTETYNWLMSTLDVPKLSIRVDSTIYPILPGLPGESQSNPITFEKSNYNIKLLKNTTVGYLGMPASGYVENQLEKDQNIGGINIGTSNYSSDYVLLSVVINDLEILQGQKFPFGGADTDGSQFDGYGGSTSVDGIVTGVEGFGGIIPNKYLEDITVVIEKSKFVDDLNIRDIGIGVQDYGIRY